MACSLGRSASVQLDGNARLRGRQRDIVDQSSLFETAIRISSDDLIGRDGRRQAVPVSNRIGNEASDLLVNQRPNQAWTIRTRAHLLLGSGPR
jgi:hypothetical protein